MYPTHSDIRLEIEQPPGAGLRNLILNPNGGVLGGSSTRGGGWGWIGGEGATEVLVDLYAPVGGIVEGLSITAPGTAAGATWAARSARFPVTPGRWLGGSVERLSFTKAVAASATPSARFVYFDSAGVELSSSAGDTLGADATIYLTPHEVPAGAATATLSITGATGAASASSNDVLLVKHVTVAEGASSAAVTDVAYLDPGPFYTDIVGSGVDITITRDGLSVAELVATIKDANLDPATSALLRPGRRLRCQVLNGAGTWSHLFIGRVDDSPVVYDYGATADDEKRASITLRAVDDLAVLANTKAPEGYAAVSDLTSVLEDVGTVPWFINIERGHRINRAPITTNPDATALDQIIITRDSNRAHAWMSNAGELFVTDPLYLPTAPLDITAANYSADGPVVTWDIAQIVNEITLTHVVRNAITGETTQVTWGPYQNLKSIREWGVRRRDITVQGLTNTAGTMLAYANSIFAVSATPSRRLQSLTVPIRSVADVPFATGAITISEHRVEDPVTGGWLAHARVERVVHTIRPGKWVVEYGYARPGGTPAAVSSTPTPPVVASGPPAGTVGVTLPEKPHLWATKAADQNLTTGVEADIVIGDETVVGGITTDNTTVTLPRAGRYLITTTVAYASNATGRRATRIRHNGTQVTNDIRNAVSSSGTTVNLAAVIVAAAGDTVTVTGTQTSGGNLAVTAASTNLAVTYLD